MYYVLNETNQIIAADDNLLTLCGVSHIDELSSKIALGKTAFTSLSEDSILISMESSDETFSITKTSLSSMLGQLTIVEISEIQEERETDLLGSVLVDDMENVSIVERDSTDITVESDDVSDEITFGSYDQDESDTLSDLIEDETQENREDSIDTFKYTTDDELFQLLDDKPIIEEEPAVLEDSEEDNELFDLISEEKMLESTEDDFISPIDLDTDNSIDDDKSNTNEILIDIEAVSQSIGIEKEDYNLFFNEYIDTALSLEKDLQSVDTEKRSSAITTLSHLSDVLRIPIIGDIILDIEAATPDTLTEHIESFYTTLSRVTTSSSANTEIAEPTVFIEDPITISEPDEEIVDTSTEVIEDAPLELFDEPATPPEPETTIVLEPEVTTDTKGFGTISLEGITPIHFDFQLEEAANDLSLPVELIEEFVHDFIDQAHIETKKMLTAYEKGDLDAIQKIGHLLKGASSNLRINALSDTLYQIQFCEDSSKLEYYIKNYWGHFLSFENQIDVISN